MANQQTNYYTPRKADLLRDFDHTAELVKDTVVSRYGKDFAETLYQDMREAYARLIPHIPHIEGFRARVLNTFLLGSAQELAVYKGMKKHGKTAEEAWEICHEALRLRMARYAPIKRNRFASSGAVLVVRPPRDSPSCGRGTVPLLDTAALIVMGGQA